MNFYFCEGCGKRITEKEIDQGLAKDKKLKGVYCTDCSAGVMTLETLPLNPEQARQILEQSAPAAPSTSAIPERRGGVRRQTSFSRIPPAVAAPPSSAQAAEKGSVPPWSGRGRRLLWAGAAVVLLLGGLVLYLLSSPGHHPPDPPPQAQPGPLASAPGASAGNASAGARLAHSSAPDGRGVSLAVEPLTVVGGGWEQRWAELERRLQALSPQDWPGRITLAEAEQPYFAGTPRASQLEAWVRDWRQREAAARTPPSQISGAQIPGSPPDVGETPAGGAAGAGRAPQAGTDSPVPPVQDGAGRPIFEDLAAPAPKPDPIFTGELEELLRAVSGNDLEGASAVALRVAKDSAPGGARASCQELPAAIGELKRLRLQRKKETEGLLGQELAVGTRSGRVKGTVTAVTEDGFQLQRKFTINGQERLGPAVQVGWTEVAPEELARLLPPQAASNAPARLAVALQALAGGRLGEARIALRQLPEAALRQTLLALLDAKEAGLLEARARQAWASLSARSGELSGEGQVKSLLGDLDRFEQEYAGCELTGRLAPQREALRRRLLGMPRLSAEILGQLFRGQARILDPKTSRVGVHYDFQVPLQLDDFALERGKREVQPEVKDGAVRLRSVSPLALSQPRFDPDQLELSFRFALPGGERNESALAVVVGRRFPLTLRLSADRLDLLSVAEAAIWAREPFLGAVPLKGVAVQWSKGGRLRLLLKGTRVQVALNDQLVLETDLPSLPEGALLALGTSKGNTAWEVDELALSGHLDQAWLTDVLKARQVIKDRPGQLVRWVNRGGDGKWATSANWEGGRLPKAGDLVVFESRAAGDCTVAAGCLPKGLKGLVLGEAYGGRVFLEPDFAEGYSQVWELDGSLVLASGSLEVSAKVEGERKEAKGTGVTIRARGCLVAGGAALQADGRGFPIGAGPEGGTERGGHGYADPKAPLTLGSASSQAPGGGAILLQAPKGSVVINGRLSANGGDSNYAGAGGSLYVLCGSFEGGGLLQTRGGIGRHCGQGGPISVVAERHLFAGCLDACAKNGEVYASPGTLHLPGIRSLTVTAGVALASGEHQFDEVVVKSGGLLVCRGDPSTGMGCKVKSRQVVVEQGGVVSAVGQGFGPLQGPGEPGTTRAGASHGGKGGCCKAKPYGDPEAPRTLGSGTRHGWGGGALELDLAEGLLRVEGSITVGGQGGSNFSGGGAGGSLLVRCGSLEGSGSLLAEGGTPGPDTSHGGGGGRIAVYYRKKGFSGKVSAAGGKAADAGSPPPKEAVDGEDGTVVLRRW